MQGRSEDSLGRGVKVQITRFFFKAVFHYAKFFDRIEIFFCLTSIQMELNRNRLNLNNRKFTKSTIDFWGMVPRGNLESAEMQQIWQF